MMMFRCHRCGRERSLEALLDDAPSYHAELDLVTLYCPDDAATVAEVRLQDGQVIEGYTYAAGALHFSPEREHPAPSLSVKRGPDELRVAMGARNWVIPMTPRP